MLCCWCTMAEAEAAALVVRIDELAVLRFPDIGAESRWRLYRTPLCTRRNDVEQC